MSSKLEKQAYVKPKQAITDHIIKHVVNKSSEKLVTQLLFVEICLNKYMKY